MRFTRLRLNGFKSFVDPTDLVIHDGLTGVVGPNGCGKSNLLEAMRWVMGENRPSAMRGGGMEDVIFAGAATRPARHFAEVALVIDNQDRLAPSGFNPSRLRTWPARRCALRLPHGSACGDSHKRRGRLAAAPWWYHTPALRRVSDTRPIQRCCSASSSH